MDKDLTAEHVKNRLKSQCVITLSVKNAENPIYTMNCSNESGNFLDTTVKIVDNRMT
jgi:hypothetical protein